MNTKQKLMELNLKGYCCSQIIVEMGLEKLGKTNHDLIEFAAGLCEGLHCDKTCGAFSAALCLLYMADPVETDASLGRDFTDWFEASFGSTECEELMGGNKLQGKVEVCPNIIEASFEMISELLDWD